MHLSGAWSDLVILPTRHQGTIAELYLPSVWHHSFWFVDPNQQQLLVFRSVQAL